MFNEVDFLAITPQRVTFKTDGTSITYDRTKPNGSAQVERAVTLVANKTMGLAGDGDLVAGKLERVESDGMCVVLTGGYGELPGGTTPPTFGKKIVGSLGAGGAKGYIRAAAAADALNARGMVVDAADPAAIMVRL